MSPQVIVLLAGCVVVILLSVASIFMAASLCRGATSTYLGKNLLLTDLPGGRLRIRHQNRSCDSGPPVFSRWLQPLGAPMYPVRGELTHGAAMRNYSGGLYNDATRGRVWDCRLPRYVSSASDAYSFRRDDRYGSADTLYRA